MNLILKNGEVIPVCDNSTVSAIWIPVESYAEIDALAEKFTPANLSEIQLGTTTYRDVLNESAICRRDIDGQITVAFVNRDGTEDRIQDALDAYTLDLIEGGII